MNSTRLFGNQRNSAFGKTLLTLAVGAGLGIAGKTYISPTQGYTVKNDMIYKRGFSPREISIEQGHIQVGTLTERVNDLLYENPAMIKKTVEELYATYLAE